MPTGYTAAIKDGISFQKFALSCAREFGALIMMRDDPMDAPIPDEFQPSDYHVKELARLEERKKELVQMALNDGAAAKAADEYNQKQLSYWQEIEAERTDLRNKYNEMLAEAIQWLPPTKDHEGLKEFMIQQIRDSIKWDCNERERPIALSTEEWYKKECEDVQSSIEYHTKENEAEIKRTKERNDWVRELKNSLNPVAIS